MGDKGDKKRKYLLFKKDDGRPDSMKPCAFFASSDGCKNGSNCRFSHQIGPDGAVPATPTATPTAAPTATPLFPAYAPPAAPIFTSPTPVFEEKIKSDKKKRRTNEFLEQAASAPAPVPAPAATLPPNYQQLMEQQKLLEQQLRSLSAMMTAPAPAPAPAPAVVFSAPTPSQATSVKKEKKRPIAQATTPSSSSSALKPGNLFPSSTPMIAPMPVAAPLPVPVLSKPVPVAPVTTKSVSYESSSDEEEFLYKAVNHALDNGRHEYKAQTPTVSRAAPAPKAAPVATTTIQPDVMSLLPTGLLPSAVSNDSAFPFVEPSSAIKALETSGTTHATLGPGGKRGKKDIFASPAAAKGAQAVPVFDPSSVNFASINWEALVARTIAHKRYAVDYSFPNDPTWITARSEQSL
jgi:hypothetical protein